MMTITIDSSRFSTVASTETTSRLQQARARAESGRISFALLMGNTGNKSARDLARARARP
eukprot:2665653-Lingulodinium_polyedra.AAC.1